MGFFRRRKAHRSGSRPTSGDGGTGRSTGPAGESSSEAASDAGDQRVELLVVVPGELSGTGELTLQGSVQVGLLTKALREERLDGLYSCDTGGCLRTAEKIGEGRAGLEIRAVPRESAEIAEWLSALRGYYAGRRVLLVADETVLRRILAGLEEVAPEETSIPPLGPASISRITIRQDLSFSMRVNNTDHLDGITNSDRFRML